MQKVLIFLVLMSFLQDTVQSKARVAVQARPLSAGAHHAVHITPQNVALAASVICAAYCLYVAALKMHIKKRSSSQAANMLQSEEIFIKACCKGDSTYIELALKAGVNKNVKQKNTGITALMFAVFLGQPAIVKKLIAYGADCTTCDALGNTAIDYAWGNQEILSMLQKAEKKARKIR